MVQAAPALPPVHPNFRGLELTQHIVDGRTCFSQKASGLQTIDRASHPRHKTKRATCVQSFSKARDDFSQFSIWINWLGHILAPCLLRVWGGLRDSSFPVTRGQRGWFWPRAGGQIYCCGRALHSPKCCPAGPGGHALPCEQHPGLPGEACPVSPAPHKRSRRFM